MTSLRLPLWLLSTSTLLLLFTTYLAVLQSPDTLSPQGCRMSWMSPSYILHDQFNSNWTRHARRYSLWLYREAGWESPDEVCRLHKNFGFLNLSCFIAQRNSCAVHSWKRWVIPSGSLYCFICHSTVLFQPIRNKFRYGFYPSQTFRFLCRSVVLTYCF